MAGKPAVWFIRTHHSFRGPIESQSVYRYTPPPVEFANNHGLVMSLIDVMEWDHVEGIEEGEEMRGFARFKRCVASVTVSVFYFKIRNKPSIK